MSEKSENGQISDQVAVEVTPEGSNEVKGPDPEVWGQDADRPEATDDGLAIGEIRDQGGDNERKGPGLAWETDDEGNYINR